jgi:hypothetical protein
MSHRITTKTDIKDKDVAIQALKDAGWKYTLSGYTLTVTSGPMRNARINTQTGLVSGDTDWHSGDTLGALRQRYAEVLVRREELREGNTIESRETLKNGDVRLVVVSYG